MADDRSLGLQLRIGGFILAGLGVFLAIIYLLGAQARYFERKYDLIAEFDQVSGLIEGATVRLAGVQIGRVTDVTLPPQPGGKVKVTLTIAKRVADRIRRNSKAQIVTQGLLGDKLVEISIGSADSPPLQPGDHMATVEPFETSQVIAEAGEAVTSVKRLANRLNGAAERIGFGLWPIHGCPIHGRALRSPCPGVRKRVNMSIGNKTRKHVTSVKNHVGMPPG